MLVRITLLAMMATQCACFLPAAPARVGLRGASMQASSPQNAPAGDLSRRSFFGKFSAGVTVGALGLEVPQAAFAADLPVVNSPAPDFDLPSNRGKNYKLADLKGKYTVLYFYPGDFTSGCTIEAQNFEKNAERIRALGAEIVGVSVDGMEKHLDFAKQYGLSFPLLSDNGGKVSAEYGTALKIPFMGTFSNRQTYIIDPNGNLKWVFTDVQSRLAKHADEVVDKLKELTKA